MILEAYEINGKSGKLAGFKIDDKYYGFVKYNKIEMTFHDHQFYWSDAVEHEQQHLVLERDGIWFKDWRAINNQHSHLTTFSFENVDLVNIRRNRYSLTHYTDDYKSTERNILIGFFVIILVIIGIILLNQ
jgi:hypothetical protein